MKLNREEIKNAAAWNSLGISVPSYDPAEIADNTVKSPVWVHFGIGNIFRIVYINIPFGKSTFLGKLEGRV